MSKVEQMKARVRAGDTRGMHAKDPASAANAAHLQEYSRQRSAPPEGEKLAARRTTVTEGGDATLPNERRPGTGTPHKKTTREVTDDALAKQRQVAIDKINARRAEAGLPPAQMPKAEPAPATPADALAHIIEDATADRRADAGSVLEQVGALVTLMRAAEDAVTQTELELSKRKAELNKIAQVDLPELLHEAKLAEVTLEDGTNVKVQDEISCSITVARRAAAHAWLREHGFGGVIKTAVSVAFGKDELDAADDLYKRLLDDYGSDAVEQAEAVHPATLKALLKEQLAKVDQDPDKPIDKPPFELFSIQPYSIAKLSQKKPRKGEAK